MKRHVVLDSDVEDLIAPHIRKKGDLSRLINEALRFYYVDREQMEKEFTEQLNKALGVKDG